MDLLEQSKAHLRHAGETYAEHLRFAWAVGGALIAAGVACIIHALVPGLFTSTASRTLAAVNDALRSRSIQPIAERPGGTAAAYFPAFLVLCLGVGLLPWAVGAQPVVALFFTLLAGAMTVAFVIAEGSAEPAST